MDNRVLDIFVELVKIEGTSGDEKGVAAYISDFLKGLGIVSYTDDADQLSKGNSGNLIAKIDGGGNYFVGAHMDTARSTKEVKVVLKQDRISSDGTTQLGADNRAGIAIILAATERAVKCSEIKPVTLLFTVCEETTLAGSLYYEPDPSIGYGFILDSHMRPGNFVLETPGAINFEITVNGVSAHAGIAPEKGISAIKVASEAINSFPFGWIDDKTTANIGVIRGGESTNVVCDKVTLKGELRTGEMEHGEMLMGQIIENFSNTGKKYGVTVESNYFWDFLPYTIKNEDTPYIIFEKVCNKLGLTFNGEKSFGGSDANSFNSKGIKCINLGIGAQNPHADDEYIRYEDLKDATDIVYTLLTQQI